MTEPSYMTFLTAAAAHVHPLDPGSLSTFLDRCLRGFDGPLIREDRYGDDKSIADLTVVIGLGAVAASFYICALEPVFSEQPGAIIRYSEKIDLLRS
jgi:hypothetical protein